MFCVDTNFYISIEISPSTFYTVNYISDIFSVNVDVSKSVCEREVSELLNFVYQGDS